MAKVYVGPGTNLGDKEQNLKVAVQNRRADRESRFPVCFLHNCPLGALPLRIVS